MKTPPCYFWIARTLQVLLAVALHLGAFSTARTATGLPLDPFLKIEAGNHLEFFLGMTTDKSRRWVGTYGDDETIRVWNSKTGDPVIIIRPPSANTDQRFSSVRFSADGEKIAAAMGTNLFVFERATGRLTKRISPNRDDYAVFHAAAFTSDGAYLIGAAATKLRAWRTTDWTVLREQAFESGFHASVYTLSEATGDIALGDEKGTILLFDPQFRVKAKTRVRGFLRQLEFSENGGILGVRCDEDEALRSAPRIELLSAKKLDRIRTISAKSGGHGDFHFFGARLYWDAEKATFWEAHGTGPAHQLRFTESGILPIDENFFWAQKTFGGFALVRTNGSVVRNHPRVSHFLAVADDDLSTRSLLLSEDAAKIWIRQESDRGIEFDLAARALSGLQSKPSANLHPTAISLGGKMHKRGDKSLKTSHATIKLEYGLFKLAIAKNAQTVAVDSLGLEVFDSRGKLLWTGSSMNVLNATADGRFLVDMDTHRNVRWRNMQNGQELLRLFLHADGKRWVIWTPEGFYDCSPGGEDLIGWQVNNGLDAAADFFPASRFRDSKYRPDVIAKVLETADTKAALRLANEAAGRPSKPPVAQPLAQTPEQPRPASTPQAAEVSNPQAPVESTQIRQQLPPVVTILSPLDGASMASADLTIRYQVRTPSGSPVTGVRVLIDGRVTETARGIRVESSPSADLAEERQIAIKLPERDCEVAIIAENKNSRSEPARARYKWIGRSPPPEDSLFKPKLYALVVGVSKYALPDLELHFAAKDARDFAASLKTQEGRLYRQVTSRVLVDREATRDSIIDGLDWLEKQVTSRDVGIVFLAGHGMNDNRQNHYFLPHSAELENLRRTCISFADLQLTLQNLAGKALFFMDTCHSGSMMARQAISGNRRSAPGVDITGLVNELSSAENGVVVFASSTGKQFSLEKAEWGNGAFTKAVVEGLNGKADLTQAGKVTVKSLDYYLAERVKELTGGEQTPVTTKPDTIPDFPIAVVR